MLIATLLVPQAAAYAFLADLPTSAGFFAAAFAPVGYALWGTSRYLSVGPVALLSLLTATAVAASPNSALETAAQLGLLVGIILILVGLLRIGHLTNFISEPVLIGFITGAALMIGMTQAGNFLGIDIERGGSFVTDLKRLVAALGEVNYYAAGLAASTLLALLVVPPAISRLCKRAGRTSSTCSVVSNLGLLGVLAIAVMATWLLQLPVDTVGRIDVSLPNPEWIMLGGWDGIRRLLPDALPLALLAYLMAYGTAANLAGRRRLSVDRDHEAGGLGLANIASAVTGGFPVGASLSRSAVASTLQTRSSIAAVVAGLLTLGVGLASTGIFEHVAKAVLAALIIKAVFGMIDFQAIARFVRYSKMDAASVLVTLIAVLVFGVRWGVAVGALTSIITYLLQTSLPRVVIEGLPDEENGPMRDTDRHDTKRAPDDVLVLRMEDALYFGNASYLEQYATDAVANNAHVDHLILDLKTAGMVDVTGMQMLERLNSNLREAGVALHIAHAHKPIELQLRHAGLVQKLSSGKIFSSARDAADALTET